MADWGQTLDLRTGIVQTSYKAEIGMVLAKVAVDPDLRQVSYRVEITDSMADKKAIEALIVPFWPLGEDPKATGTLSPPDGFTWTGTFGPSETRANYRLRAASPFVPGHGATSSDDTWGKDIIFEQTLSLGASPNLKKMFPVAKVEDTIFRAPPVKSFDEIAKRSADAWSKRWKTDIEIDGPFEDQQAVRSFLFYLRSAISPQGKMSISPMGLSNDIYGGHVFWDADIWVLPALAFIDPDTASSIPKYRLDRLDSAAANYSSWVSAGRPTANPSHKVPGSFVYQDLAIKYPWESSVTGKETTAGPSQFEDHITGSVAFSASVAKSLGLIDGSQGSLVKGLASAFYRQRSELGGDDSKADIRATMSPDENHIGDNDLYTNVLAQWCQDGDSWKRDLSYMGAFHTLEPLDYRLPQDKISFLTYDNDPVNSYKQAAAVLAIYPLQYPPAEAQAMVMMDRFADKVIKNGPAMTDSVHAIIWARLGETDKAYDTWRKGWMDFVRPPFLLFSEKRNQDRTYFTTGAAGELQSVIYGFLGFRIDSKKQAGAAWSLKLKGDRWLSIKPNLPKAWKRVTFRNFHVLGKTYTLTATHESVQVTQGD
jgi:trehalose/maltose hydrolase-like predicted phosphorylase